MSLQLVGVNTSEEKASAEFPLLTLHVDTAGNHFRYLKNSGTVAVANYLYYYDPDTGIVVNEMVSSVAATSEVHPLAVARLAVTANYYAWWFVGPGRETFYAAGTMTAEKKVYTSATDGFIDDTTSDSAVLIPGLITYDGIVSAASGICKASCELYVSG